MPFTTQEAKHTRLRPYLILLLEKFFRTSLWKSHVSTKRNHWVRFGRVSLYRIDCQFKQYDEVEMLLNLEPISEKPGIATTAQDNSISITWISVLPTRQVDQGHPTGTLPSHPDYLASTDHVWRWKAGKKRRAGGLLLALISSPPHPGIRGAQMTPFPGNRQRLLPVNAAPCPVSVPTAGISDVCDNGSQACQSF